MPDKILYRIKNWVQLYENHRTRDLKELAWVAIPIDLSGDGYTSIMEKDSTGGLFGAWIACVEVGAHCNPRGTLVRSNGEPHDAASLSRLTRIDQAKISEMLEFCLNSCKWLENAATSRDHPAQSRDIPRQGAAKRGFCNEGNGMELNGMEKKKDTHTAFQAPDHLLDIWPDYLKTRAAKRAAPTITALTAIIKRLERLAPKNPAKQHAILEQSIISGWTGVFELKDAAVFSSTPANELRPCPFTDTDTDGTELRCSLAAEHYGAHNYRRVDTEIMKIFNKPKGNVRVDSEPRAVGEILKGMAIPA